MGSSASRTRNYRDSQFVRILTDIRIFENVKASTLRQAISNELMPQDLRVLLTCGKHGLVAMQVIADGVVGEFDPPGINEFVSDLGNRPMSREPSMSDPAKDVSADRPMRWSNARFDFGTRGLGVSGTAGIGTMVELADQFHRTFACVNVAIPVIADIHSMTADRAVAIEDFELPQSEISIDGPSVRHPASLHALVRS